MSQDQYTFQDPAAMYSGIDTTAQQQDGPGLDADLQETADRGERSYRGSGRLEGRKALSYLPEEEEDAKKVVALIEEAGRKAVTIPGDISTAEFSRELVAKAVEGLGGLDILVNNAGKQQNFDTLEEISDEEFDVTFKTNVYAMFWITKAALPHLKPGSTIINTSSIQAYQPSPNLIHYATTKASINAFSKGLAQQLAPKGIRVNVVAPGPVWTPLQTAGGQPAEALPSFGEDTPLGRPGQPAELAPAFVFLASPESSYVIGETLHVNGGMPTP
jgi:NAD(P)-dependent dehydrogenase (short-subunit alcohol dehydrogenase family)